jgi:GT2 family glycosyltransferase
LHFPSGKYQKTTDIFPSLGHKVKRFFHLREMESTEGERGPGKVPCDVDYAVSAFWIFRNKLVEKIGVLDEAIFYAPEDVDYCLRCWLAGGRVIYFPTVTVVHHAQEISRQTLFSRSFMEHIKGLFYFYNKHKFMFRLDGLYARIRKAHNQEES